MILHSTPLSAYLKSTELVFELENDPALIQPLINQIQQQTGQMVDCRDDRWQMQFQVALEEAVTNAMLHGNLEISSSVREEMDGSVVELMKHRNSVTPFCDRRLTVRVNIAPDRVLVEIQDQGPGFDVSSLPNPTEDDFLERAHGRGVMLMRAFMDEVNFNACGNQVTLIKRP
ncbi:ATP-binding protein [Lignipirellula cremea]|uniref:Anti-sigma F factor n=1 Tax=Lignipirellula cremea TaxID=2528010 RepID=A0A518E183_9BACT|nr:ATP-binding protein [Lignipirellula cremea]QDU97848.1 anti-sigma F factor [Lignipirellula cremea]